MPSGASDGELDLLSALGLTAGVDASAVADLLGVIDVDAPMCSQRWHPLSAVPMMWGRLRAVNELGGGRLPPP